MKKLKHERHQLLSHWESIDLKRLLRALESVRASFHDNEPNDKKSHHIRQFHNMLGYRAEKNLAAGGLCAGCLYRTQAFVNISQECRTGLQQAPPGMVKIHVEHTVPVAALVAQIEDLKVPNRKNAEPFELRLFKFLIKYSIATAAIEKEGRVAPQGIVRPGYAHRTDAFSKKEAHYNRPFMRYVGVPADKSIYIFDVLSGEEILRHKFSFRDHIRRLKTLMKRINRKDEVSSLLKSL